MGSVDTGSHEVLGLAILELGVGLIVNDVVAPLTAVGLARGARGATVGRAAQRLGPTHGASGGQRHLAVEAFVDGDGRAAADVNALTAIAYCVVIDILRLGVLAVLGLALPPCCAEITFFALATASYAGGIVGIIDATQITTDLSPTARDAGLVNAFVLGGGSLAGRSGGGSVCGRGSSGGIVGGRRAQVGCGRVVVLGHDGPAKGGSLAAIVG